MSAQKPDPQQLFRREAIEHQARGNARSDILQVDPAATSWGYRLLAAALFCSLAFIAIGRLTEYATGPAIVRLDGRMMLTASHSALVTRIAVKPGDAVKEGDLLVQFYSSEEAAELQGVTREFDDQLRKLLQYPDDAAARESLVSLRTRKEVAEKRLSQRSLRAPQAGVVGDVRVRQGQLVEAGTSVVELVDRASTARVTVFLPGRYRPYLARGKKLRFELDGFRRRSQELAITAVGDQIIGPTEAQRFLGRDVADALNIQGPVVLVEAELPSTTFEADDGRRFAYAHGMLGKAESPVRDEPIIYAFVPTLREWADRINPKALFGAASHQRGRSALGGHDALAVRDNPTSRK
jgi:biotin carboxyl carrier protein